MRKKSIWITGASSGIGFGLAKSYIHQGHFVLVSGRNRESLRSLETMAPQRVRAVDFDLTDGQFQHSLPGRIRQHTDSLDMLILAAGNCEYLESACSDSAMYRRQMEINFFAQIECVNIAIPLMRKAEVRPQIVGVGSLAAHLPFPRAEAYGSSKAAFEYWLDSLRTDLSLAPLDITLVSPGFVDTPLTRKNDFSMPWLMSVDDACQRIVRAVEQRRRHVRFPRRLAWSLRLLSRMEWLWFEVLAPRMTRRRQW